MNTKITSFDKYMEYDTHDNAVVTSAVNAQVNGNNGVIMVNLEAFYEDLMH